MDINIILCDDNESTYSTTDLIRGHVGISLIEDCVLDELSITFEGKTTVRVERQVNIFSQAGYIFGDHTFLHMSQPPPPGVLSNDRLAKRGTCYSVPFDFRVPETLLPYACDHQIADDTVKREHSLLPPSFGSCKTANGKTIDELAPKRAIVNYRIHVRLRSTFGKGSPKVLERSQAVRIVPARLENPPLFIAGNDQYYRLRQDNTLQKGMAGIGNVLGRLQAETKQPSPLNLSRVDCETTTTALIDLRFDPAPEAKHPPQLVSVKSKLCAFTFFGATPFDTISRPCACYDLCKEHAKYKHTTQLAKRNLGGVGWVKHSSDAVATSAPENQRGLDQQYQSRTTSPRSEQEPTFYTATLQIPITLPQRKSSHLSQKHFVPTFSSCLISRCYSLEFQLSYKAAIETSSPTTSIASASASMSRQLRLCSTLDLKAPLQMIIV